MAVPSVIWWVRVAAAAKSVTASGLVPPTVDQAAGTPCCSARTINARVALGAGRVTTSPTAGAGIGCLPFQWRGCVLFLSLTSMIEGFDGGGSGPWCARCRLARHVQTCNGSVDRDHGPLPSPHRSDLRSRHVDL